MFCLLTTERKPKLLPGQTYMESQRDTLNNNRDQGFMSYGSRTRPLQGILDLRDILHEVEFIEDEVKKENKDTVGDWIGVSCLMVFDRLYFYINCHLICYL